jgi:hypothetical protein
MKDWVNCEADWEKLETEDKFTFGTQGFYGAVKRLYRRMVGSRAGNILPMYETTKMFEDRQIEFELQKSKVIVQSKLKTRLI